jgi:hypothetical protein
MQFIEISKVDCEKERKFLHEIINIYVIEKKITLVVGGCITIRCVHHFQILAQLTATFHS